MRVLIIEDNTDIAASIGDYLEIRGHTVDFSGDGLLGLKLATEHSFDAIVLDINLPNMDGFTLCEKLRNEYQLNTPVLMATARGSLADKVTGFQLGSWDYLVKPFELQELELRLQALTLRNNANQSRIIRVGELSLNVDSWEATREGKKLDLHRACLRILEMLMRASPNAVSRLDLESLLWGENPPESDPLRSHMHELRRELDKPFDVKMLQTLRGVGFVLVAQNKPVTENKSSDSKYKTQKQDTHGY